MRHKIKLLNLALIAVFVFSFTACSTPKITTETDTTETTTAEATVTETDATETTTAEATVTETEEEAERNPTIKISSIAGYDVNDKRILFKDNTFKGDVDLIMVSLLIPDFDVEHDVVSVVWELDGVVICRIGEIIEKSINTYFTGVTIAEINTYRSSKESSTSEVFHFLPAGNYKCTAELLWLTAESQECKVTTDLQEFKIERESEEPVEEEIIEEEIIEEETVEEPVEEENADSPEETDSATLGERNAAKKAKDYLNYSSFSYSGLVEQLKFEGYTHEEAVYGVDKCGADWNEQAAKKAKDYLNYSSFSRTELIAQLEFEGFTRQQAEYGAEAVGY